MKRFSTARIILEVFAKCGSLPGVSLGDIEEVGELPRGTAVHQRITDLRSYGWDIKDADYDKVTGHYLYHVHSREQMRMQKYVKALFDRGIRTAKIRGEETATP